jgi:ferredoxin-NADP reductase
LMRQYSLTVPDGGRQSYVVGIKRDPASRGGSKYIFDELKVGQRLQISEPRNNFELHERAVHTVLIAGGIGITPISAMVRRLADLARSWELHYSCRSRQDAAFFALLADKPEVRFHFDNENAGRFLDLAQIVKQSPADTHLYCCGPLAMLRVFEDAASSIPPQQVHVEYFTAKSPPSTAGGFVVQLARSGREFAIPAGQSILHVLRDAGLNIPCSCEEGVCGACETKVISGIPDHRDAVLTEAERAANKSMMICSSGSKSDKLVLDL